ncbi:hypothetical protein AB0136_26515, partial [Klebsiella pneumoniae]
MPILPGQDEDRLRRPRAMTATVTLGKLTVARPLYDFVNQEALPGTGIEPAALWQSLEAILVELMPVNQALLAKRDT